MTVATQQIMNFRILLIDDDPQESQIIERILRTLTDRPFKLDQVLKCSHAITRLNEESYDLVLLDNRLSTRMSARFSVPIIKETLGSAPLAVISNDTSPAYLQDPKTLGVDYIVDKSDMIDFLRTNLGSIIKS